MGEKNKAYIQGDKNVLLENLLGTAQPTTAVHEQMKMAIFVRCTEDLETGLKSLENSMNDNADASQDLANKVRWLTAVIAVATLLGVVVAILK